MTIPSIRSDDLARLRALIARASQLAWIVDVPLQIRFVIDANAVAQELFFLAKTRKKPDARTALQELIDSGTVIAFVPNWLREEVAEHLQEWAEKQRIPEERLHAVWENYQKYLHFCPVVPGSAATNYPVADIDDVQYVELYHQVGARAVVGQDRDIPKMGAGVVELEAMLYLRDYARAKSIELTIKLGMYSVTIVLTGSIYASGHLAAALIHGIAQLPHWVQLALIVGAGIIVLHPRSRRMLVEGLHNMHLIGCAVAATLAPALMKLVQILETEGTKVANTLRRVEQSLPPQRRTPLETVAFAVCRAAGTALTLDEIANQVRANGYISRSKDFDAYLRRVVRHSPRLVCGTDGRYSSVPLDRVAELPA